MMKQQPRSRPPIGSVAAQTSIPDAGIQSHTSHAHNIPNSTVILPSSQPSNNHPVPSFVVPSSPATAFTLNSSNNVLTTNTSINTMNNGNIIMDSDPVANAVHLTSATPPAPPLPYTHTTQTLTSQLPYTQPLLTQASTATSQSFTPMTFQQPPQGRSGDNNLQLGSGGGMQSSYMMPYSTSQQQQGSVDLSHYVSQSGSGSGYSSVGGGGLVNAFIPTPISQMQPQQYQQLQQPPPLPPQSELHYQ